MAVVGTRSRESFWQGIESCAMNTILISLSQHQIQQPSLSPFSESGANPSSVSLVQPVRHRVLVVLQKNPGMFNKAGSNHSSLVPTDVKAIFCIKPVVPPPAPFELAFSLLATSSRNPRLQSLRVS